jgi:hypothetical protein
MCKSFYSTLYYKTKMLCIRHSRSFWDRVGYDFFFHVGRTDSVMQRMQFFFLSVPIRHFLATALVQSFGSKKRGYLESFPGVLKMGNFIDFDVLFPNFNFATSYFCRSRSHIGKMAPKSSFLTIYPFRLISR